MCPMTGKRCRKLYQGDKYFYHRKASGLIYESQSYSSKIRGIYKIYDEINMYEVCQELHSKHFKKFYNGQPTKRYLKLMNKINQSERYPPDMMQRLLMM